MVPAEGNFISPPSGPGRKSNLSHMKSCLTILTLCLFYICSGQVKSLNKSNFFELKGKLIGRDTGYIVLWFPDTSGIYVRDTSYLQNGDFKFQGKVKEPSFAHLIGSDKSGNFSNFFLEAGNQSVVIEENHFDKMQMKGSKTQELNDSLQNELHQISAQTSDLEKQKATLDSALKNQKNYNQRGEQTIKELGTRINELYDEAINKRLNFIKSHPGSYVSVTELSGLLIVNRYPVNLIKPLYEALSTRVKNSRAGLYCLKEIGIRSKLTTGNYLSNFQADDIKNRHISLNDFRDKYVLIDFWASWCAPCREATPHLKKVYNQYHSKGFEIIAVSLDRDKDQWKKAIQKDSTSNWVQILRRGEMESIFKPIQAIPQEILLDQTGKIIWSSLDNNTSTWTETLANQLKFNQDGKSVKRPDALKLSY
jgi:thiol-disulfide isomerase/thioredoxin